MKFMKMSSEEFERQFAEATRRGEEQLTSQPLATAVRYSRRLRKIIVELNNGSSLLFPPEITQGLMGASHAALADAKVLGPGTTLSWPKLDVQLSVLGLLNGQFGTQAWMKALAKRGSRSLSPKQRRAKAG
jgi:hypothetical protein